MNKRIIIIASLPITIFVIFSIVLIAGLSRNDDIPSNLLGRSAPTLPREFILGFDPIPEAALSAPTIKIINFWASWCGPCKAEHPNIEKLAQLDLKLYGVNLKDNSDSATKFLTNLGNPYHGIGTDKNGKVAIDWGVYGVPETFIVNANGKIVYRHPGPITNQILEEKIMPIIKKLNKD